MISVLHTEGLRFEPGLNHCFHGFIYLNVCLLVMQRCGCMDGGVHSALIHELLWLLALDHEGVCVKIF